MTPRTFLIVALLAVASLVTAVVAVVSRSPPRYPIEMGGTVLFPGLADQTVARLSVRAVTGSLTIEQSESGWHLKERDGYPVNVTKVRETVVRMAQTVLLEPKTAKSERHALLDLVDPDDPSAETTAGQKGKGRVLTLEDATGKVLAALIVGKRRFDLGGIGSAEEGIYVRRPGEIQTWLARTSLFPATELRGWVDQTVIGIDPARVTRVTFRHPDGQVVTVSRTDNGLPVVQPFLAHANIDESAAQRVLALLSDVTFEDVHKKDTSVFKIDKTIRIEVTTREGLLINVAVRDHDGSTWIMVNATGRQDMGEEEEAKTINDRTRSWSYRLPSYNVAVFHSRQNDLVKKGADGSEAERLQH